MTPPPLPGLNAGDWAGIVGVVVSVAGFGLTLFNVRRAKTAADQAKDAANAARESLSRFDLAAELGRVRLEFREIKRLQRLAEWPELPDRYSAIRESIVLIRTGNAHLTEQQQASLTGTLTHLTQMEEQIEAHLAGGRTPPNVAKSNSVLSRQMDEITEIMAVIRSAERGGIDA